MTTTTTDQLIEDKAKADERLKARAKELRIRIAWLRVEAALLEKATRLKRERSRTLR